MSNEAYHVGPYIAALRILIFAGLCTCQLTPMEAPPIRQAYAFVGGTILLNCTSPDPTGHVSWHRPLDGVQVTLDKKVTSGLRQRLRILGNPQRGQYNLLIRSIQFPADNGTWWCSSFGRVRQPINLLVLVPPAARVPEVTPISGIVFHVDAAAYTFTCTAHYAFPPVQLTWVKKQGPLMEYNPLPMRVNMAPDYTMSASANLILSPMNHGSVFTCVAQHPTFNGKNYSTDVQFVIADSQYDGMKVMQSMSIPARRLPAGDVAMVVIVVLLVIFLVTFVIILWRLRDRWELDVRYRSMYQRVPTQETDVTSNGSIPHSQKSDHNTISNKERRHFLVKLAVTGVLLLVLVIVLSFLVPVYINGYAIPIEGVDQIVTVFAGTLLWLDCSSMATKSDDLLVVGWRRNYYKFYNQYNNDLLKDNFGYPINSSTESYDRGLRTQNHKFGQISIYPALPGDEGLYICEIARIQDDSGKTVVQMKTFAVGILTGVPINKTLIGLTILGLISVLTLVCLVIYHSIRRVPKECINGVSKTNDKDVEKYDSTEEKEER